MRDDKEIVFTSLDKRYAEFRNEAQEWFDGQKTDLIEAKNTFFKNVSEIISSCFGTKTSNLTSYESEKDLPERILYHVTNFNAQKIKQTLENQQEIEELKEQLDYF